MMGGSGYTLAEVARVVGGTLQGGHSDDLVQHLVSDSRGAIPILSALFVALKGPRHDGHMHVEHMAQRGVRAFLVNEGFRPAQGLPEGSAMVVVKDTLDALQRLAAWHRGHFRGTVVGITGSNGKTIVKEWLFQALGDTVHLARSPGSWNSQVGVPLSLWGLGREHEMALIEAGISQPGEMERLRAMVKPTIGIFTNIGPAHSEHFRDDLHKAMEKAILFREARAVVYCLDHGVVGEALRRTGVAHAAALVDWSRERSAFVHLVREEAVAGGTRLTYLHGHAEHHAMLPFTDKASVDNAMHVLTLLLHLGHDPEWIAERLARLVPVSMRLEVLQGAHGCTIINDAYSNDLASLSIALDQLVRLGQGRRKVLILGDLAEHGSDDESLLGHIAALLRRASIDLVLAVGQWLSAHRQRLPGTVRAFADHEELLARVEAEELGGATVLVKGARRFALEHVVERWQEKVHGTVLEIDLDAIRHNLNHFKTKLKPTTKVMAMVKAFGYGGGAVELARLFAHEQVHYLGVAYADEGVELRQQGIRIPIMVMNPEPVPHGVLDRFRLEAEVYGMASLEAAEAHARGSSDAPPVHLKLDTGMRRLGFTAQELPGLLERLRLGTHLRFASILSHFAAAEDPAQDGFTKDQLKEFLSMSEAVVGVLGYRPMLHMANSAAASRLPQSHLDMVRLGIGLHGLGWNAEETAALKPAATLSAPLASIKHLPAGTSVGYGRRFMASIDRTIATVPLGYADGLSRRLGNGVGQLWIKGMRAPFVGNICMDMCMVDVTGIPCHEGDTAHLFDGAYGVDALARTLDTIPYEVLTSISPRVRRVYVRY